MQLERQSRKLFLWKIGVHDQKERVFEMRRWNEALVTNMLPEHVAKHFLGSKKRDEVYLSVCQVKCNSDMWVSGGHEYMKRELCFSSLKAF